MSPGLDLIERLIIRSANSNLAIGLLNGQMGSLIVIAEYAREYNKPYLEIVSDALFTNVIMRCSKSNDFSFNSGMAGVCWGIEYLLQTGILSGDGNELCESIDSYIMNFDLKRIHDFSVSTGVLGLWLYVKARIQGNVRLGLALPFDQDYLTDWNCILQANEIYFPKDESIWLMNKLYGIEQKDKPLSYKKFINLPPNITEHQINSIALTNGLAGIISQRYL